MIDDADLGVRMVWRELLFGLAVEVSRELQLLLVLAIHEDPSDAPSESSAVRSTHKLIERGLAERIHLEPFTPAEVGEWLGHASDEAVDELTSATSGRADLLGALWDDWVRRGAVDRAREDRRWEFSALDEHVVLTSVAPLLRADIEQLADTTDSHTLDDYTELLAYAALEGRRFTVEAVSAALGPRW